MVCGLAQVSLNQAAPADPKQNGCHLHGSGGQRSAALLRATRASAVEDVAAGLSQSCARGCYSSSHGLTPSPVEVTGCRCCYNRPVGNGMTASSDRYCTCIQRARWRARCRWSIWPSEFGIACKPRLRAIVYRHYVPCWMNSACDRGSSCRARPCPRTMLLQTTELRRALSGDPPSLVPFLLIAALA